MSLSVRPPPITTYGKTTNIYVLVTFCTDKYIVRAHNPSFVKVSRQTTTRDLSKLFTERRNMLKNSVLSTATSVALTSDICSGNAKEDYISVVAHYVSAD